MHKSQLRFLFFLIRQRLYIHPWKGYAVALIYENDYLELFLHFLSHILCAFIVKMCLMHNLPQFVPSVELLDILNIPLNPLYVKTETHLAERAVLPHRASSWQSQVRAVRSLSSTLSEFLVSLGHAREAERRFNSPGRAQ